MYFIYVIQSENSKRLYVGYSRNPKARLRQHNKGGNISTKNEKPWRLIYIEGYTEKKDALGREKFLKSGSGTRYLKKQLKHYFGRQSSQ